MDDAILAPDGEAPSPPLPAISPHRAFNAALVEKGAGLRPARPLRKYRPGLRG